MRLYLGNHRPDRWMSILDGESRVVLVETGYRTIYRCFDSRSENDLLA